MSRTLPADYNITIMQRASFVIPLKLYASGQPVNLTGCTIKAQIWKDQLRREKITDLYVINTNLALGSFSLTLPRSITRTISSHGFWDCLIVYPDGEADYWLRGLAILCLGLADDVA